MPDTDRCLGRRTAPKARRSDITGDEGQRPKIRPFHRAWVAADRAAFYAVACWETRDGATQFFTEWDIQDEPGEVAIFLEGDIGLVPVP